MTVSYTYGEMRTMVFAKADAIAKGIRDGKSTGELLEIAGSMIRWLELMKDRELAQEREQRQNQAALAFAGDEHGASSQITG